MEYSWSTRGKIFFKKSKKSLIPVSKRVIDLYKSLDSELQKWPKEELVHAEQRWLGITGSYYRSTH